MNADHSIHGSIPGRRSWPFSWRKIRNGCLALALAAAIPVAAEATWSIVMIDLSTGEVAIGSATCLQGLDLEVYTPVMLVGIGGACAQSSIDSTGRNRQLIRNEMLLGTSPTAILNKLSNRDSQHQSRQYGIVDLRGRRATFTGTNCGPWAGGVVGKVGTVVYSIQGNVLTGSPVVSDTEAAILNTTGDLAEKLMAAMEAAQKDGGDGRCSCDPNDADRCGSPPPGFDPSVDKSADIGFMMISRHGDDDGGCDSTIGCADGSYYMNLNVAFSVKTDPDPVIQLRGLFDSWRASWRGRPDHILSTATLDHPSLPGNGTGQATMTLVMNDWEGNPVGHGGATVKVFHSASSAGLATIGTPVDHGDGSYTVPLTAGIGQGEDRFDVIVNDGQGEVTLYPDPTLVHTETLTADAATISAAAGGTVHFDLFGPEEVPPSYFFLLASASGTSPGTLFGDVLVPLNFDDLLIISYVFRDTATFVNTAAQLQADGTSNAQFVVQPDDLTPLVGLTFDFAYFTHSPMSFASNSVALQIDP